MNRAHAFAPRVERDFVDAWIGARDLGFIKPTLARHDAQGSLRLVPQAGPDRSICRWLIQTRIVAQRSSHQHRPEVIRAGFVRRAEACPRRIVANPGYLNASACHPHIAHGHLVLRQRPALVSADHGCRAECFDNRQFLHQHPARRQTLHSHGQRQRHRWNEPFRHHCHDHTCGKQQCVHHLRMRLKKFQ